MRTIAMALARRIVEPVLLELFGWVRLSEWPPVGFRTRYVWRDPVSDVKLEKDDAIAICVWRMRTAAEAKEKGLP